MAPAKAPVLAGVIDLVTTSTTTAPALSTSRPTDCTKTGALIAYAQQVAAMNKARDAQAKSQDEETVYMYMSHFFDLPSMCANPTAYYPDWITNSDRTAYDNYLSVTNTQLMTSAGQMILAANTLADNPVPAIQKVIQGGYGNRLVGGVQATDKLLAGGTLIDELPTVVALLDANKRRRRSWTRCTRISRPLGALTI